VPKYLSLYTGYDGFHPTFNGKIAYMDLMIGTLSFYTKGFENIPSYMKGLMEFSPKSPIIWEQPDLYFDLDHKAEKAFEHEWEDGDTPETNIDGIAEYAIGMWFRYLSTYPKRVVRKAAW
jgi:hypothetical protein